MIGERDGEHHPLARLRRMRVTRLLLRAVHHRGLPPHVDQPVLGIGGHHAHRHPLAHRVRLVLRRLRTQHRRVVAGHHRDLRRSLGSRGVGDREFRDEPLLGLAVGVLHVRAGGGVAVTEVPLVRQVVAVEVERLRAVERDRAGVRVGLQGDARDGLLVARRVHEALQLPRRDVGEHDVAARGRTELHGTAHMRAQRRTLRCLGQPALVVVADRPQLLVGVVAEEVRAPVLLRIGRSRVDHSAGDAVSVVHALAVAELHQRRSVGRVIALGQFTVAGRGFGALPARPAVVTARLHEVDLLPPVPPDVAHDGQPGAWVEGEPEGAAEPAGEDLAACGVGVGGVVEGIASDALPVGGEVQDLALQRVRLLGPQGQTVGLGVARDVADRHPEGAVVVGHDAGDAVHVGVTGQAQQFRLTGQARRFVRSRDLPPRERQVVGTAAGGDRPGEVDVAGGLVVGRDREPHESHVLLRLDGEVAECPRTTVGRHPRDRARLARGERAPVGQVGEVGQVSRRLTTRQLLQRETFGQVRLFRLRTVTPSQSDHGGEAGRQQHRGDDGGQTREQTVPIRAHTVTFDGDGAGVSVDTPIVLFSPRFG